MGSMGSNTQQAGEAAATSVASTPPDATDAPIAPTAPAALPTFPRVELPPVPRLSAAMPAPHVPNRDEPVSTWTSPLPMPVEPRPYTYQVVPPPPPSLSVGMHPAPAASSPMTPMPAPVPAPIGMPAAPAPGRLSMPTAPIVTPAPASAPVFVGVDSSNVAIAMLILTALLLAWASGMAFSAGLLAFGALLVAQVAEALAHRPAASNVVPRVLAVAAGIVALLAAKGAVAQFGEMAMVAGMFVVVACIPALLLICVTQLVLHRRDAPSVADAALRRSFPVRAGALVAVLGAGGLAFSSFNPKPDAFVALGVAVFAVVAAVQALRADPETAAPSA